MHFIPHGLYLAYHHFDFLLVDYPAFHAGIGLVALWILIRQESAIKRQKRIEKGQKEILGLLKGVSGLRSNVINIKKAL